MLLPWLIQQFDLSFRPIVLMRHPIPCALSQQKAFGPTSTSQNWIVSESVPNESDRSFQTPISEHHEFLKTLKDPFEISIASWCLHNIFIDDLSRSNLIDLIFYEDLLTDPATQLSNIFRNLGRDMPEAVLNQINKPSRMALNKEGNDFSQNQIFKWFTQVDDESKLKAQNILDYFGSNFYSSFECVPLKK